MDTTVAIIGSGFSGIGLAIRLKQGGVEDFVVLERNEGVGGTWWANTYPGCACDVPSHLYSFSFAPNPDWTRTYSRQPEIREYLRRVAEEHGVMPHIRLDTEVRGARWDEDHWEIETSQGPVTAKVLVSAAGPLVEPKLPDFPGLENFSGPAFHSARWDHSVSLKGKRVAAIGTGASAIQFVPKIAPGVEQLHVFQRTPPWAMPHSSRPITRTERRLYRLFPPLQRLVPPGDSPAPRRNLPGAGSARARLRQAPAGDAAARARLTQAHGAQPAAGADGEGHARLPARLQAHPPVQRLVPGASARQRRAGDRRGDRGARALDRDRGRHRARGQRDR